MASAPLRMPVQWVTRPGPEFRGFAGTIVSGSVQVGQRVVVVPSGLQTRVERIVTYDGEIEQAVAEDAVTLTFADEIDASRGDLIAAADAVPEVADQVEATLVWMGDEPMLPGRTYLLRAGTSLVTATIAPPRHRLDVDRARARAGPTARPQRDRACARSRSGGRSPSTRIARTATPGASSSSTGSPAPPSGRG